MHFVILQNIYDIAVNRCKYAVGVNVLVFSFKMLFTCQSETSLKDKTYLSL